MARAGGLSGAPAPFILTLEMDGEAFAAFDALRRKYYAPERNLVPAHVTLFHTLPADRGREIRMVLAAVAAGEKSIEVEVGEAKAIAQGVAVFLNSPRLHALREQLTAEWWPWLADRDKVGFRPHVTIQTTENEAEARRTLSSLGPGALPRRVRGIGLHLWRYRDGPWESERLFRFS